MFVDTRSAKTLADANKYLLPEGIEITDKFEKAMRQLREGTTPDFIKALDDKLEMERIDSA